MHVDSCLDGQEESTLFIIRSIHSALQLQIYYTNFDSHTHSHTDFPQCNCILPRVHHEFRLQFWRLQNARVNKIRTIDFVKERGNQREQTQYLYLSSFFLILPFLLTVLLNIHVVFLSSNQSFAIEIRGSTSKHFSHSI
jgi:hypothetical protein